MVDVRVGHIQFSSSFDSGNLSSVSDEDPHLTTSARLRPKNCFFLQISPDGEGTDFETAHNRSWFYFSATFVGSAQQAKARPMCRFTVVNIAAQNRIFDYDNRPVVRIGPAGSWARLPKPLEVEIVDPDGNVKPLPDASAVTQPVAAGHATSFVRKITRRVEQSTLRISWTYVFSSSNETVQFAMCYPYSYAHLQRSLTAWQEEADSSNIALHREVLTKSVQGRLVDLVTISGRDGASEEQQPHFSNIVPLRLPGCPRPPAWPGKKSVVLTARVHSGETPASHVLHGIIDFLLSSDPRAVLLRSAFVFHIVPMINPDGVALGHYRTDSRGVNLNRCYDEPSIDLHPAIFAIRQMLRSLSKTTQLYAYIDFHAHASKRGCFVFANAWDEPEVQVANMLMPRLFALNSPHFDFMSCDFTSRSMTHKSRFDTATKEGTGRVALALEAQLVHSYTFEASYNSGVPTSKQTSTCFTQSVYADIGKSIAISLLDAAELNPKPKVAATAFVNNDGLRQWLRRQSEVFHTFAAKQTAAVAAQLGGRRKAREALANSLNLPAMNASGVNGMRLSMASGE